MIVYEIKNCLNGKCYVGRTVCKLTQRISVHLSNAKKGSKFPVHLALAKYGIENFNIRVLATAENIDELNAKEIHWIKKRRSLSPGGYNLTPGGDGVIHTKELRERQRISAVKRGLSKKFLAACKRNQWGKRPAWNKGKQLSASHRASLSISHTGYVMPEEQRQKISDANKRAHKRKPGDWACMAHDAKGRFVKVGKS